jgi:carbonic anhydrase/acetyltransferase-like protein (isoleucine patch superfamily)
MALVLPYLSIHPDIADGVFLASTVQVIGDVVIGEDANIWYGTVIRGDVGAVRIGKRANIQDLCCLHMTKHISTTVIGDDVSIGHSVIVHGATVEDGALIGMGCILMDNAVIGADAIVGAGSLVTGGVHIPPRTLALGRPARVVRELTDEELGAGRRTSERYLGLAQDHRLVQPPPTK